MGKGIMKIVLEHNGEALNKFRFDGGMIRLEHNPLPSPPPIGATIDFSKVIDWDKFKEDGSGTEVMTYIVKNLRYTVQESYNGVYEKVCRVGLEKVEEEAIREGRVVYRYYKGGLYELVGYTQPFTMLFGSGGSNRIQDDFTARHHDIEYSILVYVVDGEYYTKEKGPFVIYKSLDGSKSGTLWAREEDDFNKHVGIIGEQVKRFTKIEG